VAAVADYEAARTDADACRGVDTDRKPLPPETSDSARDRSSTTNGPRTQKGTGE
jgi:hypothetical protein